VANLLELAGLCLQQEPAELADQVADQGASGLKALVIDAVNDHFAPLRRRWNELLADAAVGGLDQVIARGNEHANLVAEHTLNRVRVAMEVDIPSWPFTAH
jgi:tryptophanyl-tRNA synthetase